MQEQESISHLPFRPSSIEMSTAAAPPPVALPRITVQPDYPAVLRDIHQVSQSPSFPLESVTHPDSPSRRACTPSKTSGSHATPRRVSTAEYASRRRIIAPSRSSREMEFQSLRSQTSVRPTATAPTESLMQYAQSELSISCDNLAIPSTPVHFPVSTPFTLKGGIDALAISSNGASFLVGGKDSKVRVGSVSGEKIVELRGHVGDLTSVAWVRLHSTSQGFPLMPEISVSIERGSLDWKQRFLDPDFLSHRQSFLHVARNPR